mgnify:CR=1 FL=1
MSRRIHMGISTCPNDTFAFHGLLCGAVRVEGGELRFERADVQELNEGLRAGRFDVAAVLREFDAAAGDAAPLDGPERLEQVRRLEAVGVSSKVVETVPVDEAERQREEDNRHGAAKSGDRGGGVWPVLSHAKPPRNAQWDGGRGDAATAASVDQPPLIRRPCADP